MIFSVTVKILIFSMKITIFSVNFGKSWIFFVTNLMIFSMIFLIHKISYYTVRVSTGGVETRWLGMAVS